MVENNCYVGIFAKVDRNLALTFELVCVFKSCSMLSVFEVCIYLCVIVTHLLGYQGVLTMHLLFST